MASTLKNLFTNQEVARFYKKRNVINVVYLAALYFIAALIIGLYPVFGNWPYIIIGFLVMGAVQHTLATFVHESAHLNLFTNRKLNDFLGTFSVLLHSSAILKIIAIFTWNITVILETLKRILN